MENLYLKDTAEDELERKLKYYENICKKLVGQKYNDCINKVVKIKKEMHKRLNHRLYPDYF